MKRNLKTSKLIIRRPKKEEKSAGFSLIELIVAVFVLIVGVLGVYSVQTRIIADTTLLTSKFTASYLVQEGIEIVRNIRDKNWVAGGDWKDNISPGSYQEDYSSQDLNDSYSGSFLKIDSSGFYGYSAGTATKFKREISIAYAFDVENNDIIKIISTVRWQEHGRNYEVAAEENLYNWNPQ